MICNAHIDPIWQWDWPEGVSATLSTFYTAARLCDEFDYIFCHGEALLYEEVEKKAPALFKEKAEYALSLFASTSPSYLILQSLDATNQNATIKT